MSMLWESLRAAWGFGSALLLTVAVEAPVAWLLGIRTAFGQMVLLLINVVTNPLLNLALTVLAFYGVHRAASPLDPVLLALEVVVFAVEALMLRLFLAQTPRKAILISAAANAASWLAGALLLWK